MKNRLFDLIFLKTKSSDYTKRFLHLYQKADKIFIFGEKNSIDLSQIDYLNKSFFIPINGITDSNFSVSLRKTFPFLNPYPTDIFIISEDNQFPDVDLETYSDLLKSNPIIHRMSQGDHKKPGSFAFTYSHFLIDNDVANTLNNLKHQINVGEYYFLDGYIEMPEIYQKPKIYDCFIFNDELEMLRIRLDSLKDKVDKFVLVESNLSHSGNPKKSYYKDNKELFQEYSDKIIHVLIDKFPDEMIYLPSEIDVDPSLHIHWFRENYQRNEILKGLYSQQMYDNDVVLISDVDEIPHPEMLEDFINSIPPGEYGFQLQKWCIWSFNSYLGGMWPGTAAIKWKDLKKTTPQEIRRNRYNNQIYHTNEKYGWHCSWFGGIDVVMNKLSSFAHQELRDMSRDEVSNKMTMNLDIHGHQLLTEDDNFHPAIS